MLQQLRLCPVTHCYVLKSVAISTFMSLRVLYRHGSSLPRRSKPASGSRLGTLSQTEPSRSVTFSVTPRRFRHSPPSISFQCPRVCSSNRRSASKERSSEMVSSPSLRRSSVIPAQAGIQSCPCHRDVTTTTAVPCYTGMLQQLRLSPVTSRQGVFPCRRRRSCILHVVVQTMYNERRCVLY
jgi:hypothetical protein